MPWIRRKPEEVSAIRKKRKSDNRRAGLISTLVICSFFGVVGFLQDYFGDRTLNLPSYLAFWLIAAGLLIVFEPLFETRLLKFIFKFFWFYGTAKQRVKRNLYAGIPMHLNPDLDTFDQIEDENEKGICRECFFLQGKTRSRRCFKCHGRVESLDRWEWIDDEENEYLTNRESQ